MKKINTSHPLYQVLCTKSRNASMPHKIHELTAELGIDIVSEVRSTTYDKYIVGNTFLRYFDAAKDQIKSNLNNINLTDRHWLRAFAWGSGKGQIVSCKIKDGFWSGYVINVNDDHSPKRDFYVDGIIQFQKHKGQPIEIIEGSYSQSDYENHLYENHQTPFLSAHMGIRLCVFMDVAEVFEELIPAKSKRTINKQKVLNKTSSDWMYLNANYLKTSIRTEGFTVAGHFRWQPCGPNMSERKLIFIDSFQKSGYTIKSVKK